MGRQGASAPRWSANTQDSADPSMPSSGSRQNDTIEEAPECFRVDRHQRECVGC